MKNEKTLMLERLIYLMNYDLSKTSKENFIITEQPDSRFTNPETKKILSKGEEEIDKEEEFKQSQEKLFESCKYFCRYPEKAICPPSNKAGMEGAEAMIQGYCYYPTSPFEGSEVLGGIFIKNNAGISFITDVNKKILYFFNRIKKENPEMYKTASQDDLLMSNLRRLIFPNIVSSFRDEKDVYRMTLNYKGQNGPWEFNGFLGDNTNEYYVQPKWEDIRTDYEKFIDKWGTLLQISVAVTTAFIGAVTLGAGWAITLEILVELGLGTVVGIREIEKGENVSAMISFATATLPFFKLFKQLKGISPEKFKSLSEKIVSSNLGKSPTKEQVDELIKTLDDDEKLIFKKMFRGDDASIYQMNNRLKDLSRDDVELEYAVKNLVGEIIKENPNVFKDIKFWDRLWVRELSSNVIVGITGFILEKVKGEGWNEKEREILDGIFVLTPDGLKKELAYNITNQPEAFKQYFMSPELGEDMKKLSQSKSEESIKNLSENYKKIMRKRIEEHGGKWTNLTPSSEETTKNETDDELRERGWIPKEEWTFGEFDEKKEINGKTWYR